MQNRKFAENFQENFLGHWGNIASVRKPLIAAVNGFALGGGKYLRQHVPTDLNSLVEISKKFWKTCKTL